jgi:hypothetical protein
VAFRAIVFLFVVAAGPAGGDTNSLSGVAPLDRPTRLLTEGIRNPADIIYFQGKYVATELLTNRLAIFEYPDFQGFEHFDPASIGQAFQSPHYLAVSPTGGLLISNGWGSSIVQIDNLAGDGWMKFSGMGKKFNAPHGICVDQRGWIYVGDSLNSRLVRFKDMSGQDWQVFSDTDKKISYIRKLLCRDDGVWISNSYEQRAGLNPGVGSNILRVTDFDSGLVEELAAIEFSNITGILPVGDGSVLVGLWSKLSKVGIVDLTTRQLHQAPRIRNGLGTPYSFWRDKNSGTLFVTHTGALDAKDSRTGAISVHTRH